MLVMRMYVWVFEGKGREGKGREEKGISVDSFQAGSIGNGFVYFVKTDWVLDIVSRFSRTVATIDLPIFACYRTVGSVRRITSLIIA